MPAGLALSTPAAPAAAMADAAAQTGATAANTAPAAPPIQAAPIPPAATVARPEPAAPATPAPPHPAPAAQLAPALVALAADRSGTQQLTVRLDPAALGQVHIQIARAHDGSATVQVTAERADTLQLLMHDAPQLHRALNAAGVPQDGRSLSFHLGDQAPRGGSDAQASGSWAGPGQGSGQNGQPRGFREATTAGRDDPEIPQAARGAWLRAGIDITA